MKKNACILILTLIGVCACQIGSQVSTPSTPSTNALEFPTITPTYFPPTATSTPTATPTSTPLAYSTPFLLSARSISPENIRDLQEVAIFGRGKVNNFRYSSDGKLLAVATKRGIYIYDAQIFLQKKYILTDDSVNDVAFSPDGRTIAATFRKGAVRLWQLSNGKLLDTLENSTGHPSGSLLFSPDGSLLFSTLGDSTIHVWRISDGKLIHTFLGKHEYSADEMVDSLSISSDGSLLATVDDSKVVWIRRVSTGKLVHSLEGEHVAFSPDGKILAVGRQDPKRGPQITLWQVSDWALINTLSGTQGQILNLVFSPGGETLLVNDLSGEARLWQVASQPAFTCFQCSEKNFRRVLLFSPDGANLAILNEDGVLQVWNLFDGKLLHTFDEHMGTVVSLAFSQDRQFLAGAGTESVNIWRIPDGTLLKHSPYKNYSFPFHSSIAFSTDDKLLAFGPFLGGLYLWNTDSASPASQWNYGQTISSLAFSPDGTTLAIDIEMNHIIEFLQLADGTWQNTLDASGVDDVGAMTYTRDSKFLALGRYGEVEIWRLYDKTLHRTLKDIGYLVSEVAFSPTGNVFATGPFNTAQWDVSSGSQLQSLPIRGHTFSPDLSIVAAMEGSSVRFYRMSDGQLLRTLKFDDLVHDVKFSFDGKLVAVAGEDGTISVWGIP